MRVVRILLVWSYFALPAVGDKFQPVPPHKDAAPEPKLVIPADPPRPMAPALPPLPMVPGEPEKLPMPGLKFDALLAPDAVKACIAKAKIDPKKFTAREMEILKAIQDGKEPSFDKVTDAWLESYLNDYNAQRKTNLAFPFVKGLLQHAIGAAPNDPFEMKKQLENRLEKVLMHEKLTYNEANKNPLDLILHGKAQCAAGTSCYSLAARLSWGSDGYRKKHPVAIYTKGHVLPGFVLEDEKGEKYLVGIETTVAGAGKRIFGKTSELAQYPDALQVIDAETYALLDLFGSRLDIAAARCLLTAGLEKTAKRDGIDLVALEKKVDAERKLAPVGGKNNGGRTSILGFGVAVVPPGDQKRSEVDVVLPPVPAPPAVPVPPRVGPPPVPKVDPKGPRVPTVPPMPRPDPKGPPRFVPGLPEIPRASVVPKVPKGLDEIFAARDALVKSSPLPLADHMLRTAEDRAVNSYLRLVKEGKTADFEKTLLVEIPREAAVALFDAPSLLNYLRAYAVEWTPPAVQKAIAERSVEEEKLRAHFVSLFDKKEDASVRIERLIALLREAPVYESDVKIGEVFAADLLKDEGGPDARKDKPWTKEERAKSEALAKDVLRLSYPVLAARKKIFAPTKRGKAFDAAEAQVTALETETKKMLPTWAKAAKLTESELSKAFDAVREELLRNPNADTSHLLKSVPRDVRDEITKYAARTNAVVAQFDRLNPYHEANGRWGLGYYSEDYGYGAYDPANPYGYPLEPKK